MSAKPWLCSAPDGLTASQERDWEGMRGEIERLQLLVKSIHDAVEHSPDRLTDQGMNWIWGQTAHYLKTGTVAIDDANVAAAAVSPDPRPCCGWREACPWGEPIASDKMIDKRNVCREKLFGDYDSGKCPFCTGRKDALLPPTGSASAAREAWEAKQKGGTP